MRLVLDPRLAPLSGGDATDRLKSLQINTMSLNKPLRTLV